MNLLSLITTLPPWALFLLSTLAGVVAAEAGVWLARREARKGSKGQAAPIGTFLASMLGLLAFMLGFTFSITSSRFADRKALVVKQANALGTCYLRTGFLPDQQKLESRKILRDYVNLLVGVKTRPEIEKQIGTMEAMHDRLWAQTISLAGEKMDPQLRALYVTSVNDVIDIFGERKTVGLLYRISGTLWISIYLLFVLCMLVVGYETGSYSSRRTFVTPIMATAFALIIALIANMDSTTGVQHFKVSQEPLFDVQKMVTQQSP